MTTRRSALSKLFIGCSLGSIDLPVRAVDDRGGYPSKTVKIILPFPAGDSLDISVRLVADALARKWGKAVVVENRPGASTIIGTAAVANAPADGHTLLANVSLLLLNPILRKTLPYNPNDLTPITQINTQQLILATRQGTGIRQFEQLVSRATSAPGSIKYGTIGAGSSTHIIIEAIARASGVQFTHIPYKGGPEVIRALLADDLDIAVLSNVGTRAHFESGRLIPLAVTGPRRMETLSNVPTLAELGVKGFTFYSWLGLFCNAKTPSSQIARIAKDVSEVLQDKTLRTRFLNDLMLTPAQISTADFEKQIESEKLMWADHIRSAGIALE